MRRIFLILFLLVLLLTPTIVGAVAGIPIVTCGKSGVTPEVPCTPCHLFEAVHNLFDLVLIGITGPLAAFMIVIAGGMMLLGGGKPSLFAQGRTLLYNTLIGVAIILLAWVVTNTLVKSLITTKEGDSWFEFSCPTSLSNITDIQTTFPVGNPPTPPSTPPLYANLGTADGVDAAGNPVPPPPVPAGVTLPTHAGVACVSDSLKLCGGTYTCPGCPKYKSLIQTNGGSNAKMLEQIMYFESSCGANLSNGVDFGIMQMQPGTANIYAEACEIFEMKEEPVGSGKFVPLTNTKTGKKVVVDISSGWLMNPQNFGKAICLSSKFIDSLKGACGSDPYFLAAGYNGGAKACKTSGNCGQMDSCTGTGKMRQFECPWNNRAHTDCNDSHERTYKYTKAYAPKIAFCSK